MFAELPRFVLDEGMDRSVIFITGSDTGVGKTVLTCMLTKHWLNLGIQVTALKPLSSGNREDARLIRDALGNELSLDEINPWHFITPLSPLIAAQREKRKVTLKQAADHIRNFQKRFNHTIVEGAGGLLSPLGEDFDSRDLIERLEAIPVLLAPNRLGAINQVRLVLGALPPKYVESARVVLMTPENPDFSARSNKKLLQQILKPKRIHVFPWVSLKNGTYGSKTLSAVRLLTSDLNPNLD